MEAHQQELSCSCGALRVVRVKNGFAEGAVEAAVDGYRDVKLSVLFTAPELGGLRVVGEVQVLSGHIPAAKSSEYLDCDWPGTHPCWGCQAGNRATLPIALCSSNTPVHLEIRLLNARGREGASS